MPKIRDLGISNIPATMRPVEIGDGGSGGGGRACGKDEPTTKPDDGCTEPTDRDDCKEPTDRECHEPTDRNDDDEPTTAGCGGGKRNSAGLSGASVAALKQQLQERISPEAGS